MHTMTQRDDRLPVPRILVTIEHLGDETWPAYAAAVERAGGLPVPLEAARYVAAGGVGEVPAHDGLLVSGGVDVDPARYGEAPHPRLGRTVPARDAMEIELTHRVLEGGTPLLAICRGMQVLNVASGGSLLQHLEAREPHRGPRGSDASAWHGVQVRAGSALAAISGVAAGPRSQSAVLRVNSRHHQAVTPERLAPGLLECARTDEGGVTVIEAVAVAGHPFALGVQWHPERTEMQDDPALAPASTRLFDAFIAAVRASMAARPARPR